MESCLNYNEWEISDRVKIVTYRERGGGEKERAREREKRTWTWMCIRGESVSGLKAQQPA